MSSPQLKYDVITLNEVNIVLTVIVTQSMTESH